jgi:hypothetical protein
VVSGLLLLHLEHSILVVIAMRAYMSSGNAVNIPIPLHLTLVGELLCQSGGMHAQRIVYGSLAAIGNESARSLIPFG